jgi:DNA processing protein
MEKKLIGENAALVALLRTRPANLKWAELTAEVVAAGSAQAVWDRLVPPSLLPNPGEPDPLVEATSEIERWEASGLRFLSVLDSAFPRRLLDIHQVPPFLFARGEVRPTDHGVSIVGSRRASERSVGIAQTLARMMVDDGIAVIAGLAEGIDAAAHRATLDAGGRTVAFIGTGQNISYPAKNRAMQEEIASAGLLLSQFWPDAPVQKHNFLMRNALMSGYGLATIVVEAGELSGTRAQARMAVEHGRPVILTDIVVANTQWGRDLVGRPGVHVATGTSEIREIIRGIFDQRKQVRSLFASLASA